MAEVQPPPDGLGRSGPGTSLAGLVLEVGVNGDGGFAKGIIKAVLAEEEKQPGQVLDRQFIETYTSGFDEFATALKAASWNEIVEQSGVARDAIESAAKIFIESERTIVCWAMG